MDFLTFVAVAGAISSAIGTLLQKYFERSKGKTETLEVRIDKLTAALKSSSQLVSEVESEIQARKELVVELQKDAEKYEKLISLNQEQVDAVAQVLQGELTKESGKSFKKSLLVNFIFFLLGASASWYFSVGT